MDEQLFYIENNIVGKWNNDRFLFDIKEKDSTNKRQIIITAKDNEPTKSSIVDCYIDTGSPYCKITITYQDGKIYQYGVNIDASNDKLIIIGEGAIWELMRHA